MEFLSVVKLVATARFLTESVVIGMRDFGVERIVPLLRD